MAKSNWLKNKDAKKRIKDLLKESGLPLEFRVSQICEEFASKHNKKDGIRVSAERIVYGVEDTDSTLREVDQCVNLYEEFEVGEQIGIQFSMHIPIECKHRDSLELFGFPGKAPAYGLVAAPVASDLVGSNLVRRLGYYPPKFIENEPLSSIGLMEIKPGKTPRIYKENLIYKAGASLYDFVKLDLAGFLEENDIELAEEMGILGDFSDYLEKNRYAWWSVMRRWLAKDLSSERYDEFNRRYYDGRRVYHLISVNFPVVCVDAPLYLVILDKNGDIRDFTKKDYLVTGNRIPGWPSVYRYFLARPTPETLVTISNDATIGRLLEGVLQWFESLKLELLNADPEIIRRALLEASFFRSATTFFSAESRELNRYRSDLDLGIL